VVWCGVVRVCVCACACACVCGVCVSVCVCVCVRQLIVLKRTERILVDEARRNGCERR
jgi:hypothetical protein